MSLQEPVAVIMAGGEGRRFWPASTPKMPKQFLRLFGQRSLLQETLDRLAGLVEPQRVLVVTGAAYAAMTLKHLPALPRQNLVCEPIARNTGPALALASIHIRHRFGDVPVAVLPADHYIPDPAEFRAALRQAIDHSRRYDGLLALGVTPTRPETGYGYIQLGSRVERQFYRVERFREKPSLEQAESFLASSRYLWNSGMYIWRNPCFLAELAACQPLMSERFEALARSIDGRDYQVRLEECFSGLESISVDCAVMERSSNLRVLKVAFAWDDVGSWNALERHRSADGDDNIVVGDKVVISDCRECIVYAEDLPVALTGVDNLVVAASGDGVLICPKRKVAGVRELAGKVIDGRRRQPWSG